MADNIEKEVNAKSMMALTESSYASTLNSNINVAY